MAALIVAVAISIGSVTGVGVAAAMGLYSFYAQQLPDASVIEQQQDKFETVRIYDRTGQHLLYESVDPRPFRGDRTFISLDEMSPWIWKSAIALEDRNFWENPGINVRGLFRAFFSNMQGDNVQGGSSITQQLIKNVVIPPEERAEQSYARKIKEVLLAMEVTRQYSKEKILEWYLNYNFYGNLAYGVEAASQVYFGKSGAELNVAEAAMLAPIPQFPALNPITNPEVAKRRQRIALDALAQAGYLTAQEADEAYAMPIEMRVSMAERFDVLTAPHFALYALDRVKEEFNTSEDPYFIWKKGLKVYTTLDVDLQKHAETVAREQVAWLDTQDKNVNNASVVAIKPDTGEILAMVGSLDYNNREIDGQVNVALAERQPGSSFKPYVYLTGLRQGMTAASMILDVRTAFAQADGTSYVPENFTRRYHGPVSVREALASSYNIPAIRVMDQVGVAAALRTSHQMGINGLNRGATFYGLSLVLGGGEVTLLDHTYAFSVFANGGVMAGEAVLPQKRRSGFRSLDPVAVLQVVDADGNILKKYERPEVERIISSDVQYIMADILSDDVARAPMFGANSALTLPDRKVAAKTGTTDGFKDVWTMGFTPQLTVGVWVGNTNNDSMNGVTGASGAAPIWNAVMRRYHEGLPAQWYERPPNVVNHTICWPSGLLPSPYCQRQRSELFIAGSEPQVVDNVWQPFPAGGGNQVYMILPPEAEDWVRTSGIAQPPRSDDGSAFVAFHPEVSITSPRPGSHVTGQIEVRGHAHGEQFQGYRLQIGPGLDPAQWTELASAEAPVENGALGYLNTWNFAEGLYTLRLLVQRGGGTRQWNTQITIDKTPPSVVISDPQPNRIYVMEQHQQINVNALAQDTWALQRVEFYRNGQRFAVSTVAPFNERWKIEMQNVTVEGAGAQNWPAFESNSVDISPGRIRNFGDGFAAILTGNGTYLESHVFKVRAYDRAGNMAESEEVRVYVRRRAGD